METMIKVKNLHKKFGDVVVLDDINIDIDEKDIFGLIGVSGAGKSTLLRCINGLENFQSGSLKVDGIEVSELSEDELRDFRKDIGMIFQHSALLERSTVFENVAFPMQCWGYSKSDIEKRVYELLDLVELREKVHAQPRELSGGQQQRVAIARALSLNPKLLLCDEPTSSLDPKITSSILQLLRKINHEIGVTIVMVTHEMDVVKELCNNMAILSNGELKSVGKVEDIFIENPPILEELLGDSVLKEYPSEGINIKLINRDRTENDSFLSQLAIDTQIKYSLVWGGLDRYQGDLLGMFIINVDEKDEEKITDYLNKNNIEWGKITNG